MNPLELEIYHQMRNVIGIDPAFYEYIFTVDADTVRRIVTFYQHDTDIAIDCYARFPQPSRCVCCGRFEYHRYLW